VGVQRVGSFPLRDTRHNTIMAVRQAIGDSGHTQRLIRTVRGRGYGFVAPVSAWDPAVPVEEQRPPLLATPGHMDSPGSPTVLLER
jgi:DNA-binding winged helix-turn-helix (wHTH) protein